MKTHFMKVLTNRSFCVFGSAIFYLLLTLFSLTNYNAELSTADQTKTIISSVYGEDYWGGLRGWT